MNGSIISKLLKIQAKIINSIESIVEINPNIHDENFNLHLTIIILKYSQFLHYNLNNNIFIYLIYLLLVYLLFIYS